MSTLEGALVSGSYAPGDVTFLLREVRAQFVTVEEKERLIQSGAAHYGQLLSPEAPPRGAYLTLYREALGRHAERLARDVTRLARVMLAQHGPDMVLVSLARAGTPIGVLLRRALAREGVRAAHYSISIIRDHGVDAAALDFIRAHHPRAALVFVDGWTGKGVIARELATSLDRYNTTRGAQLNPDLHVISDPGGFAAVSATSDDYLLPSAMLNATVSGLISRTILTGDGLHGAVQLEHLRPHDLSRAFVDDITARFPDAEEPGHVTRTENRRAQSLAFLEDVQARYGIPHLNHVKPGVGEATRVLLRRSPEALLLRAPGDADTAHLRHLAHERGVPVHLEPRMPYRALALIRSVDRDP